VKKARYIGKKGKKAPATVQAVASELSITCTAETYKFVETPPPAAADEKGKKGKKKG
jgi:hypothetical protein